MLQSDLVPTTSGHIYLDHVGLFIADFATAAERLEHLGFTLTPFVNHMNTPHPGAAAIPSGTGNHCAMFQEGYLEILGWTSDTSLSQQLKERLERYPGLHLIAFAANNAATRHARLQQSSAFKPLPLVQLERLVTIDDVEQIAQFSVVRVSPETMPEGRIQIVTHHTPELVWQSRYQHHDNGAEALTGVLICVDDPIEASARFADYLDLANTANTTNALQLQRGRLVFVTAERLHELRPALKIPSVPYIAEIALRCTDLTQTESFLMQREIHYQRSSDTTLYLAPTTALGMAISFHAATIPVWFSN